MFTAICSSGLEVGNDPSIFDVGEEFWSLRLPARQEGTKAGAALEGNSVSARYLDWFRGIRGVAREGVIRSGGSVSEPRAALIRPFSSGRRWRFGDRDSEGDGVQDDRSLSLAVLEALANQLEAPARRFRFVRNGRVTGMSKAGAEGSFAFGPLVSLDLATARDLQRALRSQASASSVPRDGRVDATGAPREMRTRPNGAIGNLGLGSRYRSVGTYRRLSAPFIGEGDGRGASETEVLLRLRRLSRSVTALRLRRDPGLLKPSRGVSPLPSIDVRTFPALQELWLEEVPLKSVEGLFTLRLQLKRLSFGNASLETLTALLAPHVALDNQMAVAVAFGTVESGDGRGTVGTGVGGRTVSESGRSASVPRLRTGFMLGQEDQRGDEGELRGVGSLSGAFSGAADDLAGLRSRLGTGTPALRWALLEVLSVRWTGLAELDPSLRLLPRVRRLSLAYNRIYSMDFFQDCTSLEDLDLSFNRIKSVENAPRVLGNLRVLGLRGNRITRTTGLERVFSLEELDLSLNSIETLDEVARLSALPMLSRVEFAGNPLEADEGNQYRINVLSLLYQGKSGELERAVRTSNARNVFCLSSSYGDGVPPTDSQGAVGIVLDGQWSSRTELSELTRLSFTDAVRASPAPYLGFPQPGTSPRPYPVQDGEAGVNGDDEHARDSEDAKSVEGDRDAVIVANRSSDDVDQTLSRSHRSFGGAVDMTALANEPATVERDNRRAAGRSRGRDRDRDMRGRGRRRGTRAAAIDGPRSSPGFGGSRGDDTPQHSSISFCTVPLPAEEVDEEKEDDKPLQELLHSAMKSFVSTEAAQKAGHDILDPGFVTPTAEYRRADPRPSPSPNNATGDEGTSEAVRVEGSGSLSESGDGNSSRSAEPSNSSEAYSPGNHLNGYGRSQSRGRQFRPPPRPSVATLGDSSTDDSGPEERALRRDQPLPLQQRHRSRTGPDLSEKPGDEHGRPLASDSVGYAPTDYGGRSTVAAVSQGGVPLRSAARSLVNETTTGDAAAEGGAGNGDTGKGKSRTVGECDPVVDSPSLSSSSSLSTSTSSSQQLPPLLAVREGDENNEKMARSAELAGRLRAVFAGGAEMARLLLPVAVPVSVPVSVAELAPGSVSEHLSEDPQRDSGLAADSSMPRYKHRNMEALSETPAVGDGHADPEGVEGRGDYRGDEAYAGLLIVEHLELYLQQQVFGDAVPYLSYSDAPLPPTMNAHREQSKTVPDKVVAVFRETVLPCMPEEGLASASLEARGGRGGTAWERRSVKDLAAAGMARVVRLRGLEGEDRGITMGEVACIVVATEKSLFVIDGALAKKETLFSEAPRPRVLLVLPLGCLEKATIGFRLQKLELHMNASCCPVATREGADRYMVAQGSAMAAAAKEASIGGVSFRGGVSSTSQGSSVGEKDDGGEEAAEERVSIVMLTRDRSRTVNLFQTLEPLTTRARHALGLRPTVVNNRDEATLEAIARALPSSRTTPSAAPTPRSRLSSVNSSPPSSPRGLSPTHGENPNVAQSAPGDPAPVQQISPPSIETGDLPPSSPSRAAAIECEGGVAGMDGDGGEVVVFQLLMQRWELRPWVVAPRTLVASKEKLALMDEDHSRMQALSPQQQQQQPRSSAITTRSSLSASRAVSPPRMPSRATFRLFSGASREAREAREARADSGSSRQSLAGDASSLPESPASGKSGSHPAGSVGSASVWGGGEGGGKEMTCLDAVDLGDVIRVYQEESAPEQVVIELRDGRTFNRQRQWRLQCRTRSSAEMIASVVLRLWLQRVEQLRRRRQTTPWYRRR